MKRHVEQQNHLDNVYLAKQSGIQSRLTDCRAGGPSQSFADLVTKAEVLFVHFINEHNLPFSVGDHLTKLVKKAFQTVRLLKISLQSYQNVHDCKQSYRSILHG